MKVITQLIGLKPEKTCMTLVNVTQAINVCQFISSFNYADLIPSTNSMKGDYYQSPEIIRSVSKLRIDKEGHMGSALSYYVNSRH